MQALSSKRGILCGHLAGDLCGTGISRAAFCIQSNLLGQVTRDDLLSMNNPYNKPLWLGLQSSHSELGALQASTRASSSADELQCLCKRGELDRALDVLLDMDQLGTVPSVKLYGSLLKACSSRKALVHAMKVHAHLAKHGLETTTCLGEGVVVTLMKCGGLEDALQVFDRLPRRTVFSWTAAIAAYAMAGDCREALHMYWRMKEEGVEPNTYTFVSLLKACSKVADIEEGRRIHDEIVKYKCDSDLFVRTCLVDMYAKCGNILTAQSMFDGLSQRDVVSWTALLTAYVEQGSAEKALRLYEQMQEEGVSPNNRTVVTAIQACRMLAEMKDFASDGKSNKLMCLEKGRAIHADARKKGYESDVFVSSALVSMYGKCRSTVDAQNVFDSMSQRNVVLWTALLGVYAEQGDAEQALHLYAQMRSEGVRPDPRALATVLQACSLLAEKEKGVVVDQWSVKLLSLDKSKFIHADAQREGLDSDVFVGSILVGIYGKCGSVLDAQGAFNRLFDRTILSWNGMLAAYIQQGQAEESLHLYERMLQEAVHADSQTFVSMLQACSMLADKEEYVQVNRQCLKVKCLEMGKVLHADTQRKGHDSDVFIASSLIHMYGKCGCILNAQCVWEGVLHRNVVAWTTVLAAYVEQGHGEKALLLFIQMEEEGVCPNGWTFVAALQACGMLVEHEEPVFVDGWPTMVKSLQAGKALHADAWKKEFTSDVFIGNALISMYGKCGSFVDAQNVFDGMFVQDVVSWNAMLTVYAQHGQPEKALLMYKQMEKKGPIPNEVTLICILQACSDVGSLDICRQIHHTKHDTSPLVARALIHAYGRCSSAEEAQIVFDGLVQPDVASWTTLIAAYARQGNCAASLQRYRDMLFAGTKPDRVTFLSILSACSHAGLVETGVDYFKSMSQDYGITPDVEHYAAMVDLLGRAGYLTCVEQLLSAMPRQPDLAIWLALLAACRKHGNLVLGKHAFDHAIRLAPKHPAAYVLMWSMYADAGLWDLATAVNQFRERSGATRKLGQSWIEYQQDVYTFVVADCNHQQHEYAYDLLKQMNLWTYTHPSR